MSDPVPSPDNERWRRMIELFAAALDRDEKERKGVLDAAGADPELRRDVESLLSAHLTGETLEGAAGGRGGGWAGALTSSWRPSLTEDGRAGPSPPRTASLDPGQRLGRYEIRAHLGAGGMGEVYRAFDPRLHREVAIKIVGSRVPPGPQALRRFEQEARAASALNHPNIVTVFDIGEEGSVPYIVMELLDGESLRRVLDRPLPAAPLLNLAVQIADGLAAAHERQIVHRDLKPENILVSRTGIAKILDFGLARFHLAEVLAEDADASEQLTQEGAVLGTPGYMPPELVSAGTADARSDQFSLGVILYEMATGRRAFPGRSGFERIARTLNGEPPPLAQARPDLPKSLVRVVETCLRKAPAERFPSTREVLEELRRAHHDAQVPLRGRGARRAGNLPAQRTTLVGRQRELDAIQRLILEEDVRLLTLTGTGGTGKTRLALHAATQLAAHYEDRVVFVRLAAISDPELVAPAIAQALGGGIVTGGSALEGVIGDLRSAGAPTLLILDSFDQVIEAAGGISELIAACPDLAVIVTSREVLRLYGEHDFPVLPLEHPDPHRPVDVERLGEYPAVVLFVDRARAAQPSFRLTTDNASAILELCARLDGLPLALELAAAQVRLLSPEVMLARLENRLELLTGGARDLPGRQQTLRGTIDWSHQLLAEDERALFRRLSAFTGGFTLEAAHAVADPYANLATSVETGVRALVDKSLLQAVEPVGGEPRFLMLETIREYAIERLSASGEEERTRRAHAAYFLVLAEEGGFALSAAQEPRWLRRFEVEHDNFRSALEWLTRSRNAEWGLKMALGLFRFWERGEHLAEGRRRFAALLDLEGCAELPDERAKALFAAGTLATRHGDPVSAAGLHGACLETYRRLGDRWGIVTSLNALGIDHTEAHDYGRARDCFEQSLEIWEELGDHTDFARSLSNLAGVVKLQGDLAEARNLYRKAVAMFERLGDRASQAWAVSFEGDLAREQGDLDTAEALYRTSLEAFRSLEDRWGMGSCQAELGRIARRRGQPAEAATLYRDALSSFGALRHRRGIARVLESVACLAADLGQDERGLRLASAASGLRAQVGVQPAAEDRAELDESISEMEARLGGEAAARAWRQGAALTLDDAIHLGSEVQ
jgi:predicted ATPase